MKKFPIFILLAVLGIAAQNDLKLVQEGAGGIPAQRIVPSAGAITTTATFRSQLDIAGTGDSNAFTGLNTFSQKITPATDDGAPLGDTTHNWSDLFIASGGVINFANGNYTITHSSGLLSLSGDLTTPGAITTGAGGSNAGYVRLGQGTAPSTGTTNVTLAAPAAVTSYIRLLPAAVGSTGYVKETVSGTTQTESVVATIPATDISSGALNIGNNAATVGTVELANGTANTLSASGGVVSIEGVVMDTVSATNTLTNKRVTARITTIISNATPTVNTDACDVVSITAQAADITSMSSNLTGSPQPFDQLEYAITGTAARAITWNSSGSNFTAGPVALPTTTVTTKTLHVYFERNAANTTWLCMSASSDL